MVVPRPELHWYEKLYLPSILGGLSITGRYFFKTLFSHLSFDRQKRVTQYYPEEKWTLPEGYRGAPVLVKDEEGREKCVSCQLCEFVCPPKAIRIVPGEIAANSPHAQIEKAPQSFEIDMLRCIYCGMCQEVCPEEAIWLQQGYLFNGYTRKEMVHTKEKLYEMGGQMQRPIKKWKNK